MARRCSVLNCQSRANSLSTIPMFRFPLDIARSKVWLLRAANPIINANSLDQLHNAYRICRLHFMDSDFLNPSDKKLRLINNALPTRLVTINNDAEKDILPVHKTLGSQRHMLIGLMKNQLNPNSTIPIEIWQTPAFIQSEGSLDKKYDKQYKYADIIVIQGKAIDRIILNGSNNDCGNVKLKDNVITEQHKIVAKKSNDKTNGNTLGITSNTAGELCIQKNGMSITDVTVNSSPLNVRSFAHGQNEIIGHCNTDATLGVKIDNSRNNNSNTPSTINTEKSNANHLIYTIRNEKFIKDNIINIPDSQKKEQVIYLKSCTMENLEHSIENSISGQGISIGKRHQRCKKSILSSKAKPIVNNSSSINTFTGTSSAGKKAKSSKKTAENIAAIPQTLGRQCYVVPQREENHNCIELLKLLSQRSTAETPANLPIMSQRSCRSNANSKNQDTLKNMSMETEYSRDNNSPASHSDKQLLSLHVDESIQSVINNVRREINEEEKNQDYKDEEKENQGNLAENSVATKHVITQSKNFISKYVCEGFTMESSGHLKYVGDVQNDGNLQNGPDLKNVLPHSDGQLQNDGDVQNDAETEPKVHRHYDDDSSEDEKSFSDDRPASEGEGELIVRDKLHGYRNPL